jgi:soluble lytic murein transglycosylase-like protein
MDPRLVLAIIATLPFGYPSAAETPAPFPEFSPKRVKPPSSGTKKRITIQIEPEQPVAKQATIGAGQDAKSPSTAEGRFPWFWESVSADIASASPARLETALQRIGNPPVGSGISAPRLQQMQEIAQAQGVEILKSTVGTEVSPALVLAVIAVESGGKADAVSKAGAQGLMQLMPATAERFGVAAALSAPDNIRGGVAYLDWLIKRFDRDPILVLAGYNAGENAVASHAGFPPYGETRDYVPKVLAAYSVARGLCRTPPELISDGCVFVTR